MLRFVSLRACPHWPSLFSLSGFGHVLLPPTARLWAATAPWAPRSQSSALAARLCPSPCSAQKPPAASLQLQKEVCGVFQ